ncbi:transposase [Streptomyces sp. NPDC086554]|uniref:transposase n=1 Tax=Streptomyces sp. NPDC086554 TaxID=3154864 RepID=UPI00342DB77C
MTTSPCRVHGPGQLLITDKGFASKPFERSLSEQGITLLRPSTKREATRPSEPLLKKVRQLIESVNDTLKGQLNLEQHGGRTCEGIAVRVAQRVLALTAAIWHNFHTSQTGGWRGRTRVCVSWRRRAVSLICAG